MKQTTVVQHLIDSQLRNFQNGTSADTQNGIYQVKDIA